VIATPPNWIVRSGILIIFIFILVFIGFSFFLKYPDTISADAELVSVNPPVYIRAKSSGMLGELRVKNNDTIKQGDIIGILQNSANLKDILELDSMLVKVSADTGQILSITNYILEEHEFGELALSFFDFQSVVMRLSVHLDSKDYLREVKQQKRRINGISNLIERQRKQLFLTERELEIEEEIFNRNSILYKEKVISKSDYESAEIKLISSKKNLESQKLNISSSLYSKIELEGNLVKIELAHNVELKKLWEDFNSKLSKLKEQLYLWKEKYLLVSPISGKVEYISLWKENQYVELQKELFVIIPALSGTYVCKLTIPEKNSGKVDLKAKVLIHLHNFPSAEYGTLEGEVSGYSQIPTNDKYYVDVILSKGLFSSYGGYIPTRSKYTGSAVIITKDRTMFERIMNRLIFYNK
jgi:HlyD family secretion protein